MYRINQDNNIIEKLEKCTFSQLGFKEREHLQEWIANDPTCLADEELLIIQKEFDGFEETRERLDLLALDKQGNLVIIENKLDDSGKDVTWQALKYASYCSTLSKEDIKRIFQDYLNVQNVENSAEEVLAEFLKKEDYSEVQINEGSKQRIILIAAKFRKEVTSTVLWLMNFNIRIQCFKVTPYKLDEKLFLNLDQILPVIDAQEYTISMASKAQEEITVQENLKHRYQVRLDFWGEFIKASNQKNKLFSNISPSKDNWIGIGIGMSGVNLNIVVTRTYARGEIYINRGTQMENKKCFDFLEARKEAIESDFNDKLEWERMNDKVSSRIKFEMQGVSVYEKEDWPKMIKFLIDTSDRMVKVFKKPVAKLNSSIKSSV
ncbi:MAG: DUF4268 domain-containing protein [Vicingaceae bacterium]